MALVSEIEKAFGRKFPLAVLFEASMDAFAYVHLARHVAADQALYVLQPIGFAGLKDPEVTIGALASHYIEQVRRVQPSGPYLLTGMCSGGVVAFEMAQQLRS